MQIVQIKQIFLYHASHGYLCGSVSSVGYYFTLTDFSDLNRFFFAVHQHGYLPYRLNRLELFLVMQISQIKQIFSNHAKGGKHLRYLLNLLDLFFAC